MKKNNTKPLIIASVVLVVVIAAAVLLGGRMRQKSLLQRIADSYNESANATSAKYEGKKVTFLAEVGSIDISDKQMTVNLCGYSKDPFKYSNAGCVTTCTCTGSGTLERLAELKTGETVKVIGTVHLRPSNGSLFIDVDTESIS